MIVTVFRQRIAEDPVQFEEYQRFGKELIEAVKTLPGFVSFKRFMADDGERCIIVEFADEASMREWSIHPLHLKAKAFGRNFFTEYDIKVCQMLQHLEKMH